MHRQRQTGLFTQQLIYEPLPKQELQKAYRAVIYNALPRACMALACLYLFVLVVYQFAYVSPARSTIQLMLAVNGGLLLLTWWWLVWARPPVHLAHWIALWMATLVVVESLIEHTLTNSPHQLTYLVGVMIIASTMMLSTTALILLSLMVWCGWFGLHFFWHPMHHDPLEVTLVLGIATFISFSLHLAHRKRIRLLLQTEHQKEYNEAQLASTSKKLTRHQKRQALLELIMTEGVWELDLQDGRLYLSDTAYTLFGEDEESVLARLFAQGRHVLKAGEPLFQIHPADLPRLLVALQDHIHQQTPSFEAEFRARFDDHPWRWMLCRGAAQTYGTDELRAFLGTLQDIQQRKQREEAFEHDAFHDPLTGLPNRRMFLRRLDKANQLAATEGYQFSIFFIDLDHFKPLNDTLGHKAGDQALRIVAARLQAQLREEDTVARLSGDEFAILLSGEISQKQCERIASRINASLEAPLELDGKSAKLSASIGILFAIEAQDLEDSEELLKRADQAMYHAKDQGHGKWILQRHTSPEKVL